MKIIFSSSQYFFFNNEVRKTSKRVKACSKIFEFTRLWSLFQNEQQFCRPGKPTFIGAV